MRVEVLLATMRSSSHEDLIERTNIRGNVVVIDQNDVHDRRLVLRETPRHLVVQTRERGLSRSRNRAMNEAVSEICLLADDDELLLDSYEDRILTAFAERPQTAVIAFAVQSHDRLRKPPLRTGKLRAHELMKVSSVQIAFRREPVLRSGVRFNTDFGAGARFRMGEELIFLSQLHRAGMRIESVPLEIATLLPSQSTWFSGYDEDFFKSRGASLFRADPVRFRIYALQWAVRKRKLYSPEVSVARALAWMSEGAIEERVRSTTRA